MARKLINIVIKSIKSQLRMKEFKPSFLNNLKKNQIALTRMSRPENSVNDTLVDWSSQARIVQKNRNKCRALLQKRTYK